MAMLDLWRLSPPGPDNILAHPAFVQLREYCRDSYPNAGKNGPNFALSIALQTLGLPCHLQMDTGYLALSVQEAATALDAALRASQAKRIHIAPLDLAADLPPLAFGGARVCRLSVDALRSLIDAPRLRRLYPRQDFDAERFSEFHWLIVEEVVLLDKEPEERAVPGLFKDFSQDFGRIEPHKGKFPIAFEEALFFLLLVPWESWSTMQEVDWRGFRVPWVYTVHTDIFVRPYPPPSPDTLNWEPRIYHDSYGETSEEQRPIELPLEDSAKTDLPLWDQQRWAIVDQAKQSVLFETPIAHFLVRAFLTEGVDEFLAHITTIEAALGLHGDYGEQFRISPARHKGMRATDRMKRRVAGLLGSGDYATQYAHLFDVRSAFLHGRAMPGISTSERVLARSLARQVVEALVLTTSAGFVASRERFLDDLLDEGVSLL